MTAGVRCLQDRNRICLPLRVSRSQAAGQVHFEVLQRFEYDQKLMMSGVIANSNTSKTQRAEVLLKGAPFEVTQLAEPDTLPPGWGQVCKCDVSHCVMLVLATLACVCMSKRVARASINHSQEELMHMALPSLICLWALPCKSSSGHVHHRSSWQLSADTLSRHNSFLHLSTA